MQKAEPESKGSSFLNEKVEHISMNTRGVVELVEAYSKMAFQARNLANASRIYCSMLAEDDCTVILCLAGSLFSAGLKKIVVEMIRSNMVDVVVSTGANIVDQDFFEALGFSHFKGSPAVDDEELRRNHVDRIYDTFISEDDLRVCDETIAKIADTLQPRPYSSREFVVEMGRYLESHGKTQDSVVLEAFRRGVPVFVPAFSDSSAGFGLVMHQSRRKPCVSIDSAKDFLELTKVKVESKETGLLMLGGGVPKNFAQDVVVAAEVLGKPVPMHKYAVQITVADERDGGLSGSTLKEAHSWGKVDEGNTQMVFSEATIAFPILAAYAFQKGAWRGRKPKNFNSILG
ncbi:MAG: deoxyhypusine synthase [Thermoprotei archaeon]